MPFTDLVARRRVLQQFVVLSGKNAEHEHVDVIEGMEPKKNR